MTKTKKGKLNITQRSVSYEKGYLFRNWSRTIESEPSLYFKPKNLSEIIDIVLLARQNKKKIALVAQGHTWSPLSVNNDYLVSVLLLDKIRVDKRNLLVTIQPGVSIAMLDKALSKAGFCLPTNVILESVRYGGVIATGCHGAGWNNPCLSDWVEGIKMINYEGKVISITASDKDLLNAARVNLGTMGIMYEITLKVEPMFRLKMIDQQVELDCVFNPDWMHTINTSFTMSELFWFPFTNKLWLKTWTQTNEDITLSVSKKKKITLTQFATTHMGILACKVATKLNTTTPLLMNMVTRFLGNYSEYIGNAPDMIHYRKFIESVRCYNTEFAIPLGENYENVINAWRAIVNIVEEYKQHEEYPINICIEMRVCKNSEALLAPCWGKEGERFAYIEVISYLNTPGHQEASRKISYELMKLSGRPHWAKFFQVVPEKDLIPHLKNVYGDRLQTFAEVRDKFDPERIFLNSYMENILYDKKKVTSNDLCQNA